MRFSAKVGCSLLAVIAVAAAQVNASGPNPETVVVSAPVAVLVRPILDEESEAGPHDQRRLGNLLYELTKKKGPAVDEALVVLMCFYVGESQEEVDAVILRGKRMLPLLRKYEDKKPVVPGRTYPDSMLKGALSKSNAFQGAARAIQHGWKSTADNPGE